MITMFLCKSFPGHRRCQACLHSHAPHVVGKTARGCWHHGFTCSTTFPRACPCSRYSCASLQVGRSGAGGSALRDLRSWCAPCWHPARLTPSATPASQSAPQRSIRLHVLSPGLLQRQHPVNDHFDLAFLHKAPHRRQLLAARAHNHKVVSRPAAQHAQQLPAPAAQGPASLGAGAPRSRS